MVELALVGVVAGFLAGISPCILPVLPVVLVAGVGPPPSGDADAPVRRPGLARSAAVIGGLVLSFSIIVLAGSEILSVLHLPQDALRDAGIALLAVVGLGYLIPPLGELLERPFARVGARRPSGRAGGFVLGLAVGVVYVPCAGPVLAAIAVVGATHRVGLTAVILAAAFAVGTAVPLFAVALAGGQLTSRIGAIRRRARQLRHLDRLQQPVLAADYLIDAQGNVRHVHFGEGDYTTTGQLIRQLLQAAHPGLSLPAAAGIPDKTPAGEMSQETYIGYDRLQYLDPGEVTRDQPEVYQFPATLPAGAFGLAGTWTDHSQEATAGNGAGLELSFLAQDVYLVLGGTGTLDISVNGHHTQTIAVSGVPRLYTLYQASTYNTGTLLLRASPGVQAYDFTFG